MKQPPICVGPLDLTLRGLDGVNVLVNRRWLATRSIVFHCMLYGNFAESHQSVIDIGYNGCILHALVEYICMGDLPTLLAATTVAVTTVEKTTLESFQQKQEEEQDEVSTTSTASHMRNSFTRRPTYHILFEWVSTIMSLYDASNFFALPTLGQKTEKLALSLMVFVPEITCIFFASIITCNTSDPRNYYYYYYDDDDDDDDENHVEQTSSSQQEDGLNRLVMKQIRSNPCVLLENAELLFLISPLQLEMVLRDDDLETNEYTRFLILEAWANANIDDTTGTCHGDDVSTERLACIESQTPAVMEGRRRVASELTKHLHLELIHPFKLSTVISSSGLVTVKQLDDAYKVHALMTTHNKQFLPFWQSSNSTLFVAPSEHHSVELLECCDLISGIHQWRIVLEQVCDGQEYLGVASVSTPANCTDWLGRQRGGWAYGSDGSVIHTSRIGDTHYRSGLPTFQSGSTITFCLNLTDEGTLSAAVDEKAPVKLFDNMLSHLGDGSSPDEQVLLGFVPAVSLKCPGKVEFLGFEDVAAQHY